MPSNLDLWNKLGRTDPDHTKGFKRSGGFTGTAVKPIYTERKMTEQFGPAGEGWGMGEPTFQIVPGNNGEVMVYCTVSLWWRPLEETALGPLQTAQRFVYGVGGDKVVSYVKPNEQYNRPERWENDDEAFKKAFTDAVGNAMKHLGMSADVHMGLFDDSKYVKSVRDEIAREDGVSAEVEVARKKLQRERRELELTLRKELDDIQTLPALNLRIVDQKFLNDVALLSQGAKDGLKQHIIGLREGFMKTRPSEQLRRARTQ